MWEWNETLVTGLFHDPSRGLRGGSWNGVESELRSSLQLHIDPSSESYSIGFRVASPVFCGFADLDCDGDVDLEDHAAMQNAFTGPQEGGAEEEGPAVVSSRKAKGAAVGVLQQFDFVAAIQRFDQQPQNVQRVIGDPLPEDETLVLRKAIHTLLQPFGYVIPLH